MNNYRLTKRGKSLVAAFVLSLFCLINFEIFQIIVKAENEKTLPENSRVASIGNLKVSSNNGNEKSPNINKADTSVLKEVSANTNTNSTNQADLANQNDKSQDANKVVLSIPVENIFDGSEKKVVFLTFDDGPSKNVSPQILSVLKKYNLNATFFVLGKYAVANKDIIKNIYADGNVIGVHGYSHQYEVIYGSQKSFRDEITRTSNILTDILGKNFKTRLFRFPGGSFESSKNQFKNVLKDMDYVYVDWNVVIGDAEAKTENSDPKALYDRFLSTVKNKNHVILLMHDSSTKQITADILPKVIDYLKSEGYEFAVFK